MSRHHQITAGPGGQVGDNGRFHIDPGLHARIVSKAYPEARFVAVGLSGKRLHGNWRVTFEFNDGNVYVTDYEDYH